MYGKIRIAVVGASVAEFRERLGELSKIFSIKMTSFGVAELTGASAPIEALFIHSPAHLHGVEFDGYITLPYASRHPNFTEIMEALPARIRRRAVH